MQPAAVAEEQGGGERPGATLCFPDTGSVYGVPHLPPHLLERNALAGNDRKTEEICERLTTAEDIVTLQISLYLQGGS